MKNVRSLLVALLCLTATSTPAKEAFQVGDKAPEFRAGRWLNGDPIEELRKGHIYVLEFWATWCGPCIGAMPHLSELARKYEGKVTIIGVNILEKGDDPAKIENQVERFMAGGGKAMQYPVCRDTVDLHLTKKWYERSGAAGIPATIVVDGNGAIAWLGHPSKLDKPLADLVAGTFDYNIAGDEAKKQAEHSRELLAAMVPVTEALRVKDYPKVIELVDEASARDPKYGPMMRLWRYQALLHVNEDEAYAMLREAAAEAGPGARGLIEAIVREEGVSRHIYEFAYRTVHDQTSPNFLLQRAQLAFKLERFAEAVEVQRKVLAAGEEAELQPAAMDQLEADLKKYEAAAAASTTGRSQEPDPQTLQLMQEVRDAGNDPQKLDELFDRAGPGQGMLGELAGGAWKRVLFDPDSSAERRKEAEAKLRKYARAMMASEATFTHQGKTIPMTRWKGQGLLAAVEHMSPGKVMPGFGITTLEREPVALADHRGKVLLLDFWATWCKPCLASMPALKAFQDELQGKPFQLVSVNYGDSIEKVLEFRSKNEVPMPWTQWHQETFTEEYFRVSLGGLPTYIVLDPNGVILARGSHFDDRMKQTVRSAVEGRPRLAADADPGELVVLQGTNDLMTISLSCS